MKKRLLLVMVCLLLCVLAGGALSYVALVHADSSTVQQNSKENDPEALHLNPLSSYKGQQIQVYFLGTTDYTQLTTSMLMI